MTGAALSEGVGYRLLKTLWRNERPDGTGLRRRSHELVFHLWYRFVNRVDRHGELTFLNYGYQDGGPHLALDSGDEPNRYGIQLYRYVAEAVALDEKDVVEVGCGRGGGLHHLVRTFRPSSAIGIDCESAAVEFCRRRYHDTGLSFRVGDAQALDLADASCDVVLNVESSHRYPDVPAFLAEMRRILRPGGHLLLADFRAADDMPLLRRHLLASGLWLCRAEDITTSVTAALRGDDARRRRLVRTLVPRPLRGRALDFAGAVGSATFEQFAARRLLYARFVARKT